MAHISNTHLPSLKLLIGFEAAARFGNYSRAADELCVSQSAVSHQIAQLERHVGQELFRRKGRGVELTVTGRLLFESVTQAFEVIRGGLDRIATYLDPDLVTIVCPAPIAHGWLQPRLDALTQRFPALQPVISIDETARYVDEMDVDIAITREPLRQDGLREVALLEDKLCVVATPQRAQDWGTAVFPAGLLCLESDMTSQLAGPYLRQHFSELHKVAIYDDARLLLDAARRGRGIALLSQLLAHEALASGALVRLPDFAQLEAGTLWMSGVAGEPRSPLVREVFDALVQMAQ
jgi:LysR family transcriptional regulator, glycine cleavage system transcriptional activator